MKSHDVFRLPNNGIYMKVRLFPAIESLGFGAFTMLDSTGPSLDFTDIQYWMHDPNIGYARFHGTFTLGFGAFTMLDTIDPSLDFVDLQCWMHDPNIRCARFHGRYLYIHIGIWCVHNAGYYQPKSGFR